MTESQREQLLGLSDDPAFQAAAQQIVNYLVGDVTSLSAAQLKTNYNTAQSQLENFRRQLADQQDAFKIAIGLPPNIDLQIQEGPLLAPFELISQALIETEARFRELQLESGTALLPADEKDLMPGMIELADLRIYIAGLTEVRDQLYATGLAQVNEDFAEIEDILKRTSADWTIREPGKRYFSTEDERRRVVTDISRDLRAYREKERDFAILSASLTQLSDMLNVTDIGQLNHMMDSNGDGAIQDSEVPEVLQRSLDKATRAPGYQMKIRDVLSAIRNKGFNLREKLTSVAQSLEVIQAGVRVECIALNHFTIQGLPDDPDVEQVVQIGLEQRHDLMNARARVMDRRRAVEIAANQLEAALDVRINGTAGLSHQNQGISNYQAGLNFTTPLDQVIERNTYNTAIVNYQRERRAYMLLEDQIKQQIRQSWRQIQVQATRVEFDRQTVRNAAMQYENAAMQATGAGQTNALNLLNALNAIVNAQNSLVGDWVTYETNRLNIFRDMGIMEIDPRGVWVDQFYLQMDNVPASGAPAADPATSEVPQLPDLTSDAIPPVSEPLTE